MNKVLKMGFVALAMTAFVPAYAVEETVENAAVENEYEAVGWTPFALSLASPVQIPWGSHKWDVFGLNLGFLWTDAPKVYGLDVTALASATRCDLCGVKLTGLCNWNTKGVYGVRMTPGADITFGETYGIELACFAYREGDMWGWDNNFIGAYGKNFWGLQFAGILNLAGEQSYGCTAAVGGNMAARAYGLQLAGVFNFTDELHGCQIGVVNFARECPWGFQIGLVNIIMDNKIKVLPIFNAYF